MNGVLAGVRVIELGQVLAGPFAGAILADLGAEVIKIERVDGGDDARRMGVPFRHGDALNFHTFNRGKCSIAIDLKTTAGLASLDTLLAKADILIHNLRPGVPAALGIDAPKLCSRFPRLVYCDISAYGSSGPMKNQPGYEPLIQAFSGLVSTNGGPDDPPMRTGASICDQGTAMWIVIGALAMLRQRDLTGRGGVVQASLLETALGWLGQNADAHINEVRIPERQRLGHSNLVPYDGFDTADAPMMICCGNDRLFAKLADQLDRPDWADDDRYCTNRSRIQNKTLLYAELAPILRQRTRADWIKKLALAGVPCGPINSVAEALNHQQTKELAMFQEVAGEDFQLTGLPLLFDGSRPYISAVAPKLGEHNTAYGIPSAMFTPQ